MQERSHPRIVRLEVQGGNARKFSSKPVRKCVRGLEAVFLDLRDRQSSPDDFQAIKRGRIKPRDLNLITKNHVIHIVWRAEHSRKFLPSLAERMLASEWFSADIRLVLLERNLKFFAVHLAQLGDEMPFATKFVRPQPSGPREDWIPICPFGMPRLESADLEQFKIRVSLEKGCNHHLVLFRCKGTRAVNHHTAGFE